MTYRDKGSSLEASGQFTTFGNEYIILLVPYYNRFLDFGTNGFLRYEYAINERVSVAARLSNRQLFYSSYGKFYTSAEGFFSVKFE